jgi:acetyltransferase-like isoleucine patch superfamily enzyme
MAFLTTEQLSQLNFRAIGTNVLISDKASLYNTNNISIGSNVRIDDFTILSAGDAGIEIGDFVHIACFVSLIGNEKIKIGNYCGISARTSIYSSSDDYSGEFLFGPMINNDLKMIDSAPVIVKDYSIIAANCMIMPGVIVQEGVATGAFTFMNKSLDPWSIYVGIPAKKIKSRKRSLITLIQENKHKLS